MKRFIDKVLNKAYTVTNKQLMLKHGVMCSVVYGELVSKYQYYKDRGQLTEDGFFYCTLEDLKASLGINRTTQATEIKKLFNLGLIETKLCGMPAKRFIKVVEDSNVIDEFLGRSIAESSRVDNICETDLNGASDVLPSQQTSFQDDNKQVSRMTTNWIPRRQQTSFQGDNKLVSKETTINNNNINKNKEIRIKRVSEETSQSPSLNSQKTLFSRPSKTDSNKKLIEEIVEYLNLKAHKHYRPNSAENTRLIVARLNEGYTLENFKHVIDVKIEEWADDEDMKQYIQPSTLFGTKFQRYVNQSFKSKSFNTKDKSSYRKTDKEYLDKAHEESKGKTYERVNEIF